MDSKIIKDKLDKYFEGKTSLEDEQLLSEYFNSSDIDEQFIPFSFFFTGLVELREANSKLTYEVSKLKSHKKKILATVGSIAATLFIGLTIIHYTHQRYSIKDTYDDPEVAYIVAIQTLEYVAIQYQKGIEQLKPVQKVNQALQPLNYGMKTLNEELDKIKF